MKKHLFIQSLIDVINPIRSIYTIDLLFLLYLGAYNYNVLLLLLFYSYCICIYLQYSRYCGMSDLFLELKS